MMMAMRAFRVVLLLFVGVVLTADDRRHSTGEDLQLDNNEAALTLLTTEMSDIVSFQNLFLQPMMKERVSGTVGNKETQEHIMYNLKSWHIEEDTFTNSTPFGEKEFTNIIATFNPSKPMKIVLACHFDSKYLADERFVGGIDSAVPCSVLLDIARQMECLLEKGPIKGSLVSDTTLQLIFFDGEEAFQQWSFTDSLYGARHLASKWATEPDPADNKLTRLQAIRCFILFDLLGTTDTSVPQQFTETAHFYRHLVTIEQFLRAHNYLNENHPFPIFNGELSNGGIEDDHLPFLQRGVPILHLISDPFPKVWHKAIDDWNHLDFNLIDNLCRIIRVFISDLLHLQPEHRGCCKK